MQDDIGQKLLDAQLIDPDSLQKAALQQKNTGGTLVGNLVKPGAITEEKLTEFLSRLYHVPPADLRNYEPDPALASISPSVARTCNACLAAVSPTP